MPLKLMEFRGFRLPATKDTKYHSCISSIFLNASLLLVFCTTQKAILANRHNTKMKEGSMPDEQLKSVLKNSTSAHIRIATLSAFCIDS